jgi:DNA-binding NarL/FixJ family response regulator
MTNLSEMRPESQTRVLLADYAGPSRAAIAALIGGLPDITLLAAVEDQAQIIPVTREALPDVVIIDDRLLRDWRWTAEDLGARLIVIGMDDDPAYRRRAERLGAETWVAKDRADVVFPALLPDGRAVSPKS